MPEELRIQLHTQLASVDREIRLLLAGVSNGVNAATAALVTGRGPGERSGQCRPGHR